ncbi:hypothetical protein ACP3V5_06310 [Vibrio maritimus]
MTKKGLTVEHIDTDVQSNTRVLLNGTNYGTESYCYNKKSLYVKNHDLFMALGEYSITELLRHFETITVYTESADGVTPEYSVSNYSGEVIVSIVLPFSLEDWKQPWSIAEYFSQYLIELDNYPYEVSCDVVDVYEDTDEPYYDLYNGIGIESALSDCNVNFLAQFEAMFGAVLAIDKAAVNALSSTSMIERCIEFPPEYHQAGVGILSYFSSYLAKQYPENKARVRIEQSGNSVRMVVEGEDGSLETIEKALHEYELIVTGEEKAERFVNNDITLIELKSELRMAKYRIETQQDLLGVQNTRIDKLLELVGSGLSQRNNISIDFKPEISLANTININQNISEVLSSVCELGNELKNIGESNDDLSDIESLLIQLESETDPASVRRSPAMPKLKRFLTQVSEGGSELNTAIDKVRSGVAMCQDLGAKYNKVAEWCGLPVIPSIFVK